MITIVQYLVLAIGLIGNLQMCFANFQKSNITIVHKINSTHIGKISQDTLEIIAGKSISFTVDTPENEGLISMEITANQLVSQIQSADGSKHKYTIYDLNGGIRDNTKVQTGDRLVVTSANGGIPKTYQILTKPMALSGRLRLVSNSIAVNTTRDLILLYSVGQRSPNATIQINVPNGIEITPENVTVNVIGRGDVKLKDLPNQSIGRTGTNYSYSKVGTFEITKLGKGGSILTLSHLDLRPSNGSDIKIVFGNVNFKREGEYLFKANYTTSQPEILSSPGVGPETAALSVVKTIADFERVFNTDLPYHESSSYDQVHFKWSTDTKDSNKQIMYSLDSGKNWFIATSIFHPENKSATISDLKQNKLYAFRLKIEKGVHKGYSNTVWFYSGRIDIKTFGINGTGNQDDTQKINDAIDSMYKMGGGTILFSEGTYLVRTVHLKSNVYLYIDKGATIKAIKGANAPEPTWFSDRKYRSGLSPTDPGPYEDPENYLTKQDVGHTFFRNTMFFGERLDNVKIIGNGRITGDGNLVTGDRVMNNEPDNRADKMFTFKLCTNIEIGGIYREEDLWYDPDKDEPYYIGKDGKEMYNVDNMLNIDRGGHFVLLATGTDNINVHNTYFAKHNSSNARDIYDFMGCSNVTVTNIYSKVSSDDIVKLGSDCSLGFTRPAGNYKVRNIIGDTNCNLFQIGSETVDDITNVCVDNIYVLGSNKAGFSISTNDGGHVKDIHLNCGHTGAIHSRSEMYRTTTPFFISISNRGRVIGANVSKYSFTENNKKREELLCTNVNIGVVENIQINGVDIYEVYGGSSYNRDRWKEYDGSQRKASPIIAGYRLPDTNDVDGGLDFKLPNGKHTGYITNISFNDVHVLVKGGNPITDRENSPPELGVGQYNVANLGVQPAYGFWARHVKNLDIRHSTFNYENRDGRYAMFLGDVVGSNISSVTMVRSNENNCAIKTEDSSGIKIDNCTVYVDVWGNSPIDYKLENVCGEEIGIR